MSVSAPPPVTEGVMNRLRSDMRWQREARGQFPPGEQSFSMRRTREFEREPLPLLLRLYDEYGPVFSIRLMYAPVVFALGPEANHYMTVSHAANFRWRDGGMGDLIPLLGDGLLTTDGAYHRRARQIMLPAFHREQVRGGHRHDGRRDRARAGRLAPGRAARPLQLDARAGAADRACGRCSASIPTAARATPTWRRSSSARSATGARDYAVQMLRGPGSPWRRMQRARARLDRVIFAEIERRRALRRARQRHPQPAARRRGRGRLAAVASRSCATR